MKKTKKNLNKGLYTSAVLAAMIVTPYVAGEVVEGANLFENKASALEGAGTAASPYLIDNDEDLDTVLSKSVSGTMYVKLISDIDSWGDWTPKGTSSKPLQINFDGNGYKIRGTYINESQDESLNYQGFFGNLKNSVIKNVTFDSFKVYGNQYTGVVAGKATDTIFENVIVDSPEIYTTGKYAGGIVGDAVGNTTFKKSSVIGIKLESIDGEAGGVVGRMTISKASTDGVYMDDVYVDGNVETEGGVNVGGVAGSIQNSLSSKAILKNIISDAYAVGDDYIGGFAGRLKKVEVDTAIIYGGAESENYDKAPYVGGVAGYVEGTYDIKAFIETVLIESSNKDNTGVVYGGTANTALNSKAIAVADDFWEYDDINTHHVGAYEDLYGFNGFYRFHDNHQGNYDVVRIKDFSTFYYDRFEKKMMPIRHQPDEIYDEFHSAFSSYDYTVFDEYQRKVTSAFDDNLSVSEVEEKFGRGITENYQENAEYLVSLFTDEWERESVLSTWQELFQAQAMLDIMLNDSWSVTDLTMSHGNVFKNKYTNFGYVADTYLQSTKGSNYLNQIVNRSLNGDYGSATVPYGQAFKAFFDKPNLDTLYDYEQAYESALNNPAVSQHETLLNYFDNIVRHYQKKLYLYYDANKVYSDALSAVESAERFLSEYYLNSAIEKTELIRDNAQKSELMNRIDVVRAKIEATKAVQAATNAVVQAETSKSQTDVNTARNIVNQLPSSTDKVNLSNRLDVVQSEIDNAAKVAVATQAVVKAEGSKAQADVDSARTLVNALSDGADKTNLTNRLNAIQAEIDNTKQQQQALAAATQAVVKAEGSKSQTDVDDARTLVNALPDGADKTALTNRLDAVQVEIDKAKAEAEKQKAIDDATQAVVKAEGSKAQTDVDAARTLVNELPDGADKTALNERLDAVQKAINDAKAEAEKQKALEEATQAVVKAEGSKAQADVDSARTLVNELPDGADKTALIERLDAVQTAINDAKAESEKQQAVEEATQAVVKAEGTKAQADVDNARTLVNALPDGADKTALVERLDKVQAEIDNAKAEAEKQQALEEATEAVVKAEGSKSQVDVDTARTFVNNLPDGTDKTSLNERLDAVQKLINDEQSNKGSEQAIEKATQAVVKAEGSKAQSDVDDARALVNALPDVTEKTILTERLDAVQATINDAKAEAEKQQALEKATQAVVKAEGSKAQVDVDEARTLVNALSDGEDKTSLTERLNKVQAEIDNAKAEVEKQEALEQATQAVVKAEGTKTQADVDNARTLVNALPDGADKTALTERLDAIQSEIDSAKAEAEKQQSLEEATQAVVKAETTKTQADVNSARILVNALPDGADKTALTERLDAVQKVIQEEQEVNQEIELIALATQAVEKAEKDRDSRSIFSAKLTVAKLQEGEVKDALNARIKAVEDANNYAILVKNATKAVERAELSKLEKDITFARSQVNNLNDGADKQSLTERLDAIEQYDSAYESAKKVVEMMEVVPNDKNINNAQNAVDKVVNEAKKAELQARIDAVKAELNKKALEAATKLVVEAENTKTSISVINAQKAIDGLIPNAEKTALQERLDVVKAEIQKMNEDLSKFVVDEEVLKAIDEIKNESDRNALKSWKESVERGEKYFSVTMVRSIEKSIPSTEIVNNPEYALIVHQLKARYESLLLGGKEYSYVYQMMIRSAYDAVLDFEAKPSQDLKDTALKAIEIVNNAGNADNVFITVLKARILNVQF